MFKGLYTAIVTPFALDESFDEAAFTKLIEHQIAGGVDGIVFVGTTGESPTLTHEEHNYVIKRGVEIVDGRVKVIAGAGSNSTKEAIEFSQLAQKNGADGLLQVNPYYNKPNQEGLYQHFEHIADSVEIPIMLYNIMGRCGVNLETATLLRLAKHPNIVSVKEASGNLAQMKEVLDSVPSDFTVMSGDDNLTLDLMKMDGHGVVSVLSNLLPAEMKNLVDLASSENWPEAEKVNKQLSELFRLCFIEPNPQPIKTLLAHQDFCKETFRLPMVNMSAENKAELMKGWESFKG